LLGGGLVSLWLEPRRVTEDVDMVGIDGSGADRFALLGLDCLALLDRAAVEGWPMEANRVVADIDALPEAPSAELLDRRAQLRAAIASYTPAV
jgi:hypothetical protein